MARSAAFRSSKVSTPNLSKSTSIVCTLIPCSTALIMSQDSIASKGVGGRSKNLLKKPLRKAIIPNCLKNRIGILPDFFFDGMTAREK